MATAQAPLIGFKSHLHAEIVPGEAVYLVSAAGTTALSGGSIQRLAPLLDGTRSLAEIQRAAAPDLTPAQVERLIGRLSAADVLARRRARPSDAAAAAYWELAGLSADRPAPAAVGVLALGGAGRAAAKACREAGLRPVGPASAPLLLVACDDYLAPELARVNADRLADGTPWLLVRPGGAEPWIGPVFRPGAGPCWSCLAARLRAHRRAEACALRFGGPARVPDASLPVTRALALTAAALEAAKWLAGLRHDGQDAIWRLDTRTMLGSHHPVTRRPQCPDCGDPGLVAARVEAPVRLVSRAKESVEGTGHRARSPEAVWAEYSRLADPVTGVVDRIERDRRSPAFLHCYLSGANLAVAGDSLSSLRAGLRMQSGGKGVTDLDARVSALCEAVERYCGSRQGDEPVVRGSLRSLGAEAVHPDSIQLFHERQFAERDAWNARAIPFQYVPEPFDEDAELDWTPVWSLTGQRRRLLPTDLLYFRPGGGGSPMVRANSNGNAAGASTEDAILQGFLELVERDAVALWWYNRTRHPSVDLGACGDPWTAAQPGCHARLGREVWVLDVTSDLGIPVMAAVSRRVDKPAEDIVLGFGAHLDARVAVRRALAEAGQLLPAVAGARADGSGYALTGVPYLTEWWTRETVARQPYLLPGEARPPAPGTGSADLRDDLAHCCAVARRHGLEVLVLDQTRPDIGLPVVKVVVPGLRHFWARQAPGRLYDVPVRLGRLSAPTPRTGLNPIPLFL